MKASVKSLLSLLVSAVNSVNSSASKGTAESNVKASLLRISYSGRDSLISSQYHSLMQ